MVRGGFGVFWNFTPGGTSSSKAQNPPFLQSTALTTNVGQTTLRVSDGLPPPPGVDPTRPAAGTTRSIFDIYFRDGFARNWNLNVQKQLGTNYMVELAYVGSQGRNMLLKGDPNQAPPVVGVTDQNVNRPYAAVSPALRSIGQVQSTGTLDYNGFFIKVQRRFADNFSVLNSYTWNKVIDLNSDNDGGVTLTNVYDPQYNRGPADYDVTHTLSSSWVYELPMGRGHWYGGWQTSGILYLRSGLPFTVTQTQGVQSTGTGNRPNRIADGAIDNPTIERWFDTSAFVAPADVTGTYGDAGPQHPARTGPVQHRLLADQVDALRPLQHRVPRRGVQPAEPPAVRPAQRHARQPAVRPDHGDAAQPVLRPLRHDGTQHPVGDEGDVLGPRIADRGSGSGIAERVPGPGSERTRGRARRACPTLVRHASDARHQA